jgi:hypothetical protein
MEEAYRLLRKLIEEDRAAVQGFFLQLGQSVPPWLVPCPPLIVATEARYNDLIRTLKAPLGMDTDG